MEPWFQNPTRITSQSIFPPHVRFSFNGLQAVLFALKHGDGQELVSNESDAESHHHEAGCCERQATRPSSR